MCNTLKAIVLGTVLGATAFGLAGKVYASHTETMYDKNGNVIGSKIVQDDSHVTSHNETNYDKHGRVIGSTSVQDAFPAESTYDELPSTSDRIIFNLKVAKSCYDNRKFSKDDLQLAYSNIKMAINSMVSKKIKIDEKTRTFALNVAEDYFKMLNENNNLDCGEISLLYHNLYKNGVKNNWMINLFSEELDKCGKYNIFSAKDKAFFENYKKNHSNK